MTKKVETEVATTPARKRKKVYEAPKESRLPAELLAHFEKQNYGLRLVRWLINGEEDLRYLARKENEGFELVTKDELPSWFLPSARVIDSKARPGLITLGDMVLMKIDIDLRNSRKKYYEKLTEEQVASVDVNVLEKKGFRNLGSRTKVLHKEPTFQE